MASSGGADAGVSPQSASVMLLPSFVRSTSHTATPHVQMVLAKAGGLAIAGYS